MVVANSKEHISEIISGLRQKDNSIGLVPTMGALHEGHLSLIKEALSQNTSVIVSIFVNPTQFNNSEDLDKYPRTLNRDLDLLKTMDQNKIFVYAPTVQDIYAKEVISTKFDFDGLEFEMEGEFRDGHFDGVGTIVKRLFEIVTPDKAYFGEKDFQQLQIIRKLVDKHELGVLVVGCKIYREASGLAMSSRNERLTDDHKNEAPFIYKTLQAAKHRFGTKSASKVTEWVINQFANNEMLKLEYFVIADVDTLKPFKRKSNKKQYRAFVAAYAGGIRLIDNIALN